MDSHAAPSLYRESDFRYTPEGLDLHYETDHVLKPIFDQYREAGYSPREICQIMQGAAMDLMLISIL